MKIYIAGIQGTGKTSIVDALQQTQITLPPVLPSIGRTMMNMGLNINELGTEETQKTALEITLQQTLQPEGLYTRSWLDGLIYTQYLFEQGSVSKQLFTQWKEFTNIYQKTFDIYFYIRPEFDLVSDGVRSLNKKFYERSKELMEQYVHDYEFSMQKQFHILTGSIQDRVNQFITVLEKHDIK